MAATTEDISFVAVGGGRSEGSEGVRGHSGGIVMGYPGDMDDSEEESTGFINQCGGLGEVRNRRFLPVIA